YIDGAILVYDISQTNGLGGIAKLLREYTDIDSNYVTNEIPIMIIANKWDILDINKQKSEKDLLEEVKNSVDISGEEFLCNITSINEKTSTNIEEILKKCISRLLDLKDINNLNELNKFKPMMKHVTRLYLYEIPQKIINSGRKQLKVLNEEMDGIKLFLSL
ncbi:14484_t:CDS:2, partial [Cetraspora pellucida]